MRPPYLHGTDLELPRFQVRQLVCVNARRTDEAFFLRRPIEIDYMPVLVIVLAAEVFLCPLAVYGQAVDEFVEKTPIARC